jgi:hypothetical protein
MKKLILSLALLGMFTVGCSEGFFDDTDSGNGKIYYTSTTGDVVKPHPSATRSTFGADIISNKYSSGQGVITFNDEVTTIGKSAFYTSQDLKSIIIPNSVTTIGERAFSQCNSLASVTIGNGVTTIGIKAFSASALPSITIPDNVTTIEEEAFSSTFHLTSITIGNGVTTIGRSAFKESVLPNVTIPNSVTKIGDYAFYWCRDLKSITIGSGVTSIGSYAFEGFENLSVYCKATTPPSLGTDTFNCVNYDYSDVTIYVPTESVNAYKSAEGWKEYADRIVGYDFSK